MKVTPLNIEGGPINGPCSQFSFVKFLKFIGLKMVLADVDNRTFFLFHLILMTHTLGYVNGFHYILIYYYNYYYYYL